jgi:hypothetical protein
MRMMMMVLAAVLLAAPLSAQTAESPASSDAWRSMPPPDPRLRAEFAAAPPVDAGAAAWRSRLSLPQWALLGTAVGCVAGALALGSTAREGEVAPLRFNGCILGGAVGGFLAGIYGFATGAN